jgi:hypothetical protein
VYLDFLNLWKSVSLPFTELTGERNV